jgi:hypothetical protein
MTIKHLPQVKNQAFSSCDNLALKSCDNQALNSCDNSHEFDAWLSYDFNACLSHYFNLVRFDSEMQFCTRKVFVFIFALQLVFSKGSFTK